MLNPNDREKGSTLVGKKEWGDIIFATNTNEYYIMSHTPNRSTFRNISIVSRYTYWGYS